MAATFASFVLLAVSILGSGEMSRTTFNLRRRLSTTTTTPWTSQKTMSSQEKHVRIPGQQTTSTDPKRWHDDTQHTTTTHSERTNTTRPDGMRQHAWHEPLVNERLSTTHYPTTLHDFFSTSIPTERLRQENVETSDNRTSALVIVAGLIGGLFSVTFLASFLYLWLKRFRKHPDVDTVPALYLHTIEPELQPHNDVLQSIAVPYGRFDLPPDVPSTSGETNAGVGESFTV
ncbi:hypothetical protein LSAT2_021926 [Lamellibrachia satsuma]|nr:hypothetical protein LSAT2_021926 [Lamellibrachia satsuma]